MKYAPIILFVYNRPWHTQKTVEFLQKNELASKSELFIYADGAKNENDEKVTQVRRYIKTITGFKKIMIIERSKNIGLAANIIDGITDILNKYDTIIVLEDDIITSKFFLDYMNDSLKVYRDNQNVFGISAYSFYSDRNLPDTFFLPLGSSWGWATWKRAWTNFEIDTKKLINRIKTKRLIKEFNFGNYPFWDMLINQSKNKIDSWAIRFYASYFLEKGLFLFPNQSLIRNIGFGESATHTTKKNLFENKLYDCKIKVYKQVPEENKKITELMRKIFKTIHKNNT